MYAGQLRNRITIQSLQAGADEWGQPITTWETSAILWADVRFVSGMEAIKADGQIAITRASVRIRHTAGIDTTQRVLIDDQPYSIVGVLPDGRRRFIDLVAERVV